MVVVERYPELKSTQAFQDLMIQLEGTENRIAVERKNFNDAVQEYNAFIRRFPNNLTAEAFSGLTNTRISRPRKAAKTHPKWILAREEE